MAVLTFPVPYKWVGPPRNTHGRLAAKLDDCVSMLLKGECISLRLDLHKNNNKIKVS